jgi:hypothetical protein
VIHKPSDAVRCPAIVTELVRNHLGVMLPRYFVRRECVTPTSGFDLWLRLTPAPIPSAASL